MPRETSTSSCFNPSLFDNLRKGHFLSDGCFGDSGLSLNEPWTDVIWSPGCLNFLKCWAIEPAAAAIATIHLSIF
ncbi:hypothetical protein Hanom_Chr09g00841461 [Helianthus anomalus]